MKRRRRNESTLTRYNLSKRWVVAIVVKMTVATKVLNRKKPKGSVEECKVRAETWPIRWVGIEIVQNFDS